MNKTWLDYQ